MPLLPDCKIGLRVETTALELAGCGKEAFPSLRGPHPHHSLPGGQLENTHPMLPNAHPTAPQFCFGHAAHG